MESFPVEIKEGFIEPNHTMAEVTSIQAQAVLGELNELVDDAATLRWYYPGSPLWQIQRKLRTTGKHNKGRGCREAFKTSPLSE